MIQLCTALILMWQGHGSEWLDHAVPSNPATTLETRLPTCARGARKLPPSGIPRTPHAARQAPEPILWEDPTTAPHLPCIQRLEVVLPTPQRDADPKVPNFLSPLSPARL